MAIKISSSDPRALLQAIRAGIDAGHVETWSYDKDGDFTHSVPQWNNRAWLRPTIVGNQLILTIIAPVNVNLSKVVYAVYHGRFIEMALTHFDEMFSSAESTALPALGDRVAA